MDWIVKTLFELGECPSDATKLLYPGCERFSLFEALLKRLLGTEGFEYLGLQAPSEEEAERVSCIHSALCILGFRCAECEVQGSGETAERVQFLERLLRFVQRVQSIRDAASNEGSSEALLATAADMQGAIFSEAVSLLPSDVKHAAQTFRGEVGSIEDLRTALQRSAGEADSAADATAQDAEDDGAEAWEAGERELEEQLARFSDLSKGFLELHREELACWMKGLPRQRLSGIGPSASRVRRGYGALLEVLQASRDIRAAHSSFWSAAEGSETEPRASGGRSASVIRVQARELESCGEVANSPELSASC